jgi:hypothetical protein
MQVTFFGSKARAGPAAQTTSAARIAAVLIHLPFILPSFVKEQLNDFPPVGDGPYRHTTIRL